MTFSEIYEKANVCRLPVDPIIIAEALGIKVVSYKAAAEFFELDLPALYAQFPLGFSFKAKNLFFSLFFETLTLKEKTNDIIENLRKSKRPPPASRPDYNRGSARNKGRKLQSGGGVLRA